MFYFCFINKPHRSGSCRFCVILVDLFSFCSKMLQISLLFLFLTCFVSSWNILKRVPSTFHSQRLIFLCSKVSVKVFAPREHESRGHGFGLYQLALLSFSKDALSSLTFRILNILVFYSLTNKAGVIPSTQFQSYVPRGRWMNPFLHWLYDLYKYWDANNRK